MAHSSRGWSGARTPSAVKRVRQTQRRRLINQPRRTAAKTLIAKALVVATDTAANGGSAAEAQDAVQRAVSALDRAAKIGAIHKNAADRRKSRLMLKVNAALGGEGVTAAAKVARTTSKAAAAKQAKARIAASRAVKAKGAQTAAGKARAALSRTSRDTGADTESATETSVATANATPAKAIPAKGKAAGAKSSKAASKASKSAAKATAKPASASKARAGATKKS